MLQTTRLVISIPNAYVQQKAQIACSEMIQKSFRNERKKYRRTVSRLSKSCEKLSLHVIVAGKMNSSHYSKERD